MQTKTLRRLGSRAKLWLRGYSMLLPYVGIDGWLCVDEAIELYELARALPDDGAVVVEIGSWQGKSSFCLGQGLRGKRAARLCCIDPFDASGDAESADLYAAGADAVGGDLRARFEHNMREARLLDHLEVHQGFSHDVAEGWHEPIDLLFLDGDHGYGAVRRDYLDWARHVRPGGFLAMHDVEHGFHDGPRRVVDELVRRDPEWVDARIVETMFVARRRQH